MTNAERIRNMTDEELAMRLEAYICKVVGECEAGVNCIECTMNWLKQEVQEDA